MLGSNSSPLMSRWIRGRAERLITDHIWPRTRKFVPWMLETESSSQFRQSGVKKMMIEAGLVEKAKRTGRAVRQMSFS